MEMTSSEANTSSLPLLFLINVFLFVFSKWVDRLDKFFPRIQYFLQSQIFSGKSKVLVEKSSKAELNHQPVCVEKKDDGSLDREDAKMVMGKLGIFCSPESEELQESFGSDEISKLFDEEEPSLEEMKEAFNVFDENRDGFIDAKELQRVLCSLGLKDGSRLEDCKKMIRTFDQNRDEMIDFNEFVKFMENIFC
ncbi:hypothetical protein UlMin_014710 [Ulmus minor]